MKNDGCSPTIIIVLLIVLILIARCNTCNENNNKKDSYNFSSPLDTSVVINKSTNYSTANKKKRIKNVKTKNSSSVGNYNSSQKKYKNKKRKSSRNSYGRVYIRGPRGGCYYINSNGNKTYVDRSLCN